MWKVVTSSNLNPLLKLFFYSPILTNNNLLLKIYCENIIVISQIGFFILYIISLFSLFISPICFCFFFLFFFLRYLLHTRCISIPTPFFSFFSLIQVSSTPTFFSKKVSSTLSLFFSSSLSLWFFFSTRCPYISIPLLLFVLSLSCVAFILQRSLFFFFFFFFNLIPEGIMDKVFFISFPLKLFLPIWGDEICEPGRENFLPGFPLSLFSSLSQTVENTVFHSVFRSMFSIPPKITPTKHSVSSKS